MSEKTDKKIINLAKYRSNIQNSPLLQGEEVEVKEYSKGLNTLKKTDETTNNIEPEKKEAIQNQPITETQPPPEQQKSSPTNWPSDHIYNAPTELPPQDYDNDNVEEMGFGEEPDKEGMDDDTDAMSPSEAKGQAAMMINMYSVFVPPALAGMLKKDVGKVKTVMAHNSVPSSEIQKLERFLNTKNSEIEKALQLTKEQVSMLKQALSAVLERYKLSSDNPVVNLVVIIFGIAVTQFMTVSAIIKSQFEQLKEIIEAKNLSAPEGYEDFATPQGFFKKKIKIKTAA